MGLRPAEDLEEWPHRCHIRTAGEIALRVLAYLLRWLNAFSAGNPLWGTNYLGLV